MRCGCSMTRASGFISPPTSERAVPQGPAEEEREDRLFCRLLHFSGCRPSEALELTPERISLDERAVVFRSLKKRKKGSARQGEETAIPHFAAAGSGGRELDLVFNLRRKRKPAERRQPLWR